MIRAKLDVAFEREYPYLGVSGMCLSNKEFYESAGRIKGCRHIPNNRAAVKEALKQFGPLAIGISVVESMLLYNGGSLNDTTCTGVPDDLVHAVVLTGWRDIDGVDSWEIKNSWSSYWGDNGYIYVQAKNQEWSCGVTTDAVAVEMT